MSQSSSDRMVGGGSAKGGLDHWWGQRVTAVALVPLGLWFFVCLLRLPSLSYLTLVAWMREGFNGALLIGLVLVIAYHSNLGVRVVVEDYVHHAATRAFTLAVTQFIHIVLAAAAVFGVLKVAFGVAA